MREWNRFKNLQTIGVVCDVNMPESGDAYGGEAMAAYSEKIDGLGEERWPSLVCLRENQDLWDEPCSRHWWFEGWNQRGWSEFPCPASTLCNGSVLIFLKHDLGKKRSGPRRYQLA